MTKEDTVTLSIRLPRELHEWLREYSYESRTSQNLLITIALENVQKSLRKQKEGAEEINPYPRAFPTADNN